MVRAERASQPSPRASAFRVGRNGRGNWVALDQDGLRGGLFVSRAQAVRFAVLANIHHPQDVIMVSDTLELDMRESVAAPTNTVIAMRPLQLVSNRVDAVVGDDYQDAPRKVANAR
jgi:hypothetical protein